jgi:flavin-dependent dehydrogenase
MMEEAPRSVLRDVDPSALWVAYGFEPNGQRLPGWRAAEGYAYIFPKRDHVNVGIGYVLDHYRAHVDTAPYQLQSSFVDRMRRRGMLEGQSVRTNFTPFLIPVGGPLTAPGCGRVLLAGDAGGFVNGFTAEGIYYAMVSGDLAAVAILETRSRSYSSLARRYRRACRREIGRELRDSVVLQRYLFADRRRIARAIRAAGRAPGVTNTVLEFFAGGSVRYTAVRRQVLSRAPLLAGRLAWQRVRSLTG